MPESPVPQLYSTPLAHIAEMNLCFVALRSEPARVAHTTGANGIGLLVYQFYGCLVPRLYNHHRPHSALADRTPAEFAAVCSDGNDGDKAALENASRLPHSHRTAAAGSDPTDAPVSSLLLETIT